MGSGECETLNNRKSITTCRCDHTIKMEGRIQKFHIIRNPSATHQHVLLNTMQKEQSYKEFTNFV